MTAKKRTALKNKAVLKLRISGPAVRSGRISVPDLIRICQEAQNTVNRQAEALEGLKTIHPGPVKEAIRKGCTLDLVGIRKGSTTLCFVPAEPQERIEFPGQTTFASEVIGELAKTIKSLGTAKSSDLHVNGGVLQSLYAFGGIADGKRITDVEWISPKTSNHRRIAATVNKAVRERVAARLNSPRKQTAQVDGVLDMADFKPNELKCRVDPAIGAPVPCTFEERDSNLVQSLLREPVRVIGEGTFQPYTHRLESVQIRTIERLPSLSLGEGNYYAESSLADLAARQKIKPLKSIAQLVGGFPNDEDVDEFLDEIYKARN